MTFDLSHVPPVIAEDIDPRLAVMLADIDPRLAVMLDESRPDSVRVIFAGPDRKFLAALQRIYRMTFVCRDVLLTQVGAHLLIIISSTADADGLLIDLVRGEDAFSVEALLIVPRGHSAGARQRVRPRRGFADLTLAALNALIFRRVVPTTGSVQ